MAEFKERLRDLRMSKHLSQYQLADALKVHHSTISAYETGRRTPRFIDLDSLADYFGVDIDYLLGASDIRNKYIAKILTGIDVTMEDLGFILAVHRKHDENDDASLAIAARVLEVPDMSTYEYTGEPDWSNYHKG